MIDANVDDGNISSAQLRFGSLTLKGSGECAVCGYDG